jgi:hypothetical protein
VLGSAQLLPEAWASNATDPTPQALVARLERGGARSLLFRRYLLRDGTNVVDATVFGFSTPAAADAWVGTLDRGSASAATELGPAGAGTRSLFRQLDDYVVLDFAEGKVVGDLTCYAPYGESPSPACPATLRRLAGRWSARLPRG